jgi:hypothetical protein
MKFYLSREGQQLGPWSAAEIAEKLEKKALSWTDYLFDESTKEWVLLMEHPEFSEVFKRLANNAPSLNQTMAISTESLPLKNEKEWFVLKESNKYGPFKYLELVRMLQEKNLYEYDFVWNSKLSQWRRVSEVEDFLPEKIQDLRSSPIKEVQDVFFRRRYPRASYGASLVIHNSKAVWKGQSMEIGPGGAGIVVEKVNFEPGQTLFLHFKAGDGVPPFNAICTVVSKHPVPGSSLAAVRYGVKFTNISQSVQKAIKSYTDNVA